MEDGKEVTAATLTPGEGQAAESLTPNFIAASQFYVEGAGYVLDTGPEIGQFLGKQSKTKIATIIISWPLGDKGQPTKESLFGSLPQVMPWVFSADKYEKLKKIHLSGYPMHEWDIQADCEDANFQKLTFLPAKQCIFKEMLKNDNERAKEITKHIIDQVRRLAPNLDQQIGTKYTLDQLKEKLGHEVASPVGDVVASGDDVVDNLLDSMLE